MKDAENLDTNLIAIVASNWVEGWLKVKSKKLKSFKNNNSTPESYAIGCLDRKDEERFFACRYITD